MLVVVVIVAVVVVSTSVFILSSALFDKNRWELLPRGGISRTPGRLVRMNDEGILFNLFFYLTAKIAATRRLASS
jgi:hypothetical protein